MNSLCSIHSHGFHSTNAVVPISPIVDLEFESNLTNSGSQSVTITQTNSGSQSYVTGKVGSNALQLAQPNNTTGTGNISSRSYITVTVTSLSVPFSFCMWLYLNTAYTGNNSIFEIITPTGVIFSQYNSGSFWIQTAGATCAFRGSPYFTTGSWVHIVVVFSNSTTCTTYYNGSLANTNSTFTSTLLTTAGTHTFDLGYAQYQSASYGNPGFAGVIDQFLIYKTALTSAQVSSIYTGTINNL